MSKCCECSYWENYMCGFECGGEYAHEMVFECNGDNDACGNFKGQKILESDEMIEKIVFAIFNREIELDDPSKTIEDIKEKVLRI